VAIYALPELNVSARGNAPKRHNSYCTFEKHY